MENSKVVVICGPFKFPMGDAASNRVLEIAKAVKFGGCKVLVIGTGGLRTHDLQANGTYSFEGIQYDSIYKIGINKIGKTLKHLSGGMAYYNIMKKHGIYQPEIVISYGGYFSGNYLLFPFVKFFKNSKFVIDVVEWYSPEQFKRPLLSLAYLNAQVGVKYLYPKVKNIIAISSYLENYYLSKKCKVLRVPPLIDIQEKANQRNPSFEKLRIIYAGAVGKKDYIGVIIQGISLLTKEEMNRIEFNIYGPTYEELIKAVNVDPKIMEEVKKCLIIHGKVERNEVMSALLHSHFTILLRPQLRYANAGFPSKVPESLALGTPVILNYTSDLKFFIKDGYEGLIVKEFTPNALVETLRKALSLTSSELEEMSLYSRKCAEDQFNTNKWSLPIISFLDSLEN